MSRHRLLEASTLILQNMQEFAQIKPSELLLKEVVRQLLASTGAYGVGISVAHSMSSVHCLGALDDQSLARLHQWAASETDVVLPREPEVVPSASGKVLYLPILGGPNLPAALFALEFPHTVPLPSEHILLLTAALQSVAQNALANAELSDSRDRLDRFRHLYEVGQALTSSLDLDQVLRQGTVRVAEILNAEASTLLLVDESHRELVFKIPAGPAQQMLLEKRMPMDKGVAGWAATQGQPVIIPDVRKDDRFYGDVDRMTGYRTRSIMAVPLQVKGNTIGVVEVVNKQGGSSFTQDDLQWLSILAPLIAIAIDNARLFSNERQRVSELIAANTVAAALNETLELPVMLRTALLTTMNVLRSEAGEIGLLNAERQIIEFQVQEGASPDACASETLSDDCELARWIVAHGQPLIVPDLAEAARGERLRSSYPGVRSFAGVPLIGRDKTIGVLSVMSRSEECFDRSQLSLLDTIGRQIGMALENASLYVVLREERDKIIAAEETVRHELARNLHDGPAQIMASLILNIDMARRQLVSKPEKMAVELNFLESLAQEANQEVRDLLFNLRPVSLETHGLVAALAQLVDRIQAHASFGIHLDVGDSTAAGIDPKVAGTLFVIVQEALSNINKHAHATNAWIRMGSSDEHLWISVADDGQGFDVQAVDAAYGSMNSFGLLNMRERARLIEGETEIVSPRAGYSNGTLVRVDVPLSRARPGTK